MTELKPCPFCGGEAVVDKRPAYGYEPAISFEVRCSICGQRRVGGYLDTVYKSEKWAKRKAIEVWNERPNPWHTGTPTEEGWYLFLFRTISNTLVPVTRTLKEMKDLIETNPKAFFECFPYWQKIEIVKEKEDGHTD